MKALQKAGFSMDSSYVLVSVSAAWMTLTVLTFLTAWTIGPQQTVAELLYCTEFRS